jgi:hypothetical protein
MRFSPRILLVLIVALPHTCFAARPGTQAAPTGGASEHFLLDHNRVFVELTFVLRDGNLRKTLAFVDTGDPGFTFTTALAEKLQTNQVADMHVLFGGRPLNTSAVSYVGVYNYFYPGMYMFPGLHVEANLPATVLEKYDVVLDYGKQTLTLAPPKSLEHEGAHVRCRVDPGTGLTSVQAEVAGESYAFAIDNGAAYTWIDRGVTEGWVSTHPQWLRGTGAVGDANMNGSYAELTGMIMWLPGIALDGLNLQKVGALGVGPGFDKTTPNFFAWYSEKTAGPVVGFLGGNVLRSYRLEIDYRGGATYWKRERAPDPHDLDQVGIMIRPTPGGKYFVARVAAQKGKKTVNGVEAGDQLISVDGIPVTGATMGQVLAALHGKPGETRTIVLERRGKRIMVNAPVTSF